MQRIERESYSISSASAEHETGWYERLARLVVRPGRKARSTAHHTPVEGLNDHMQTLMVSDLFLRK